MFQYEPTLLTIIFVCVAGFIAAVVDSIAGGGGLIALPAVIAAGVPPHLALGTNKLASSFASFTSMLTFIKSKKIYFPLVKWQIPCTLVGATIGARTVLGIDENYLKALIVILIFAVALYTTFHKNFGVNDDFIGLTKKNIIAGCIFAFALGFYDGFFGPGAGTFLIFLFISIYGFDFVQAAGNGKILNFTSNVSALVVFFLTGKILFVIGIPMAISMIIGARVGTHIAIRNGAKVIKPIFISIAVLLAAKMIYQAITK